MSYSNGGSFEDLKYTGLPVKLNYSSAHTDEHERFDSYRSLYSAGVDAQRLGDDFRVSLTAWRLDHFAIFDRQLSGVGHDRLEPRVGRDGMSHFTLQLNRAGEYHCDTGDGFRRLAPGEILLQDVGKVARNRAPSARIVTVSVPRELILGALGGADDLHGKIIARAHATQLADFLVAMTIRVRHGEFGEIWAAHHTLGSLLALAMEGSGDYAPRERDQILQVRRRKAIDFIEANLSAPDLQAGAVALATGVSRATLYRIFETEGGPGDYIRKRRLQRLRGLLVDVRESRSLAELAPACGLASESQASRVFLDAFGMRPGEFRAQFRAIPPGAFKDNKMKMTTWFADLR